MEYRSFVLLFSQLLTELFSCFQLWTAQTLRMKTPLHRVKRPLQEPPQTSPRYDSQPFVPDTTFQPLPQVTPASRAIVPPPSPPRPRKEENGNGEKCKTASASNQYFLLRCSNIRWHLVLLCHAFYSYGLIFFKCSFQCSLSRVIRLTKMK